MEHRSRLSLRWPGLARMALCFSRWPARGWATLGCLLVCMPGLLQAQPTARDTDALRRMQRNLQQAQQERDVATSEKAALQRELTALQARQQAEGASIARLQAELRQLRTAADAERAQVSQAGQALEQARRAAEQQRQQHDSAAAQAARERAELQRELQGRTEVNQTLAARLAASTALVADLRQRNEQLHGIGLELLDQIRGAEGEARWWRREPVLGLSAVRAEDQAEQVRQRLDALRAAPTPQ